MAPRRLSTPLMLVLFQDHKVHKVHKVQLVRKETWGLKALRVHRGL